MNQPLISIVIPTYNRRHLILETIESALNQTYPRLEIIVLDNNSSDGSYEFLMSRYNSKEQVAIYKNETTLDIVLNWRKALSYANGKYSHILWSDDLIDPRFIEKCYNLLSAHKNAGFVFTKTTFFEKNNEPLKNVYEIGETGVFPKSMFIKKALLGDPHSVPVSPANALFRTLDLQQNLLVDIPNNFDIEYRKIGQGNDSLLFLLTLNSYDDFIFINEQLSWFRVHKDSLTISTDSFEVTRNYNLAKAYFVYNADIEEGIIRKFNTKLLILNLFGLFYTGEYKLKLSNVYPNGRKFVLSYYYIAVVCYTYFAYKARHILSRFF